MALASSGQLSLGNIQGEFTGSNPVALSEYYKGGSYVSTADTAPSVQGTVGQAISVGQFHGAAALPPTLAISPDPGVYQYPAEGSITASSGTATTGTVTVTPSGGVGPYSYAWAYVSGNATITGHPSGASCYWTASVNQTTPVKTGVWSVTVTDARGKAVTSVGINIDLETTWEAP